MTNLELVIDELVSNGWVEAGTTKQEAVRIPTTRCPVLNGGKSGGELATFGGRQRFRLPATDWFATVGPRTTCFYKKDQMVNYPTKFIAQISGFCKSCK